VLLTGKTDESDVKSVKVEGVPAKGERHVFMFCNGLEAHCRVDPLRTQPTRPGKTSPEQEEYRINRKSLQRPYEGKTEDAARIT